LFSSHPSEEYFVASQPGGGDATPVPCMRSSTSAGRNRFIASAATNSALLHCLLLQRFAAAWNAG